MVNTPHDIEKAFLDYYKELLGTEVSNRTHVNSGIVQQGNVVTSMQRRELITSISETEIEAAIWAINREKAPGPDGNSSQFFKDNREIVKHDTCKAVQNFFTKGSMMKQVNTTSITLIPKCNHPEKVTEFRPIACYNTIYKCITKILCNRMKNVLPHIIDGA